MKKTGVLLKAPPLGSLQWEQLSLPLSFRSQCFLAGSDSRNARLLCAPLCWSAGVWAPGPLLLLLLVVLLLAPQLRIEWAGLHYSALHCSAMQCAGWLLFLQHHEGRGAAPWRPSKAWLLLPVCGVMATRWRVKTEEGSPALFFFFPWLLYC